MTDIRDGQQYKYVQLGKQTWMADNLNYYTEGSHYYDDDSLKNNKCGRLYNWEEASAACPAGWHLPSDREWKKLERYLGLKSSDIERADYRGDHLSVISKLTQMGFNPRFAGILKDDKFMGKDTYSFYWTATAESRDYAWKRAIDSNLEGMGRHTFTKKFNISVRCVKDKN